ncbi:MAG: DUF4398 domain-containing protein [Deltaproteobacteria bacterium]|nr:DUF4398 domain-containing protein [Deltaproteobacteria bacterium]MBW2500908.1 DUF4398 domain-containing protein [Deltaproteobacteria bacterium]
MPGFPQRTRRATRWLGCAVLVAAVAASGGCATRSKISASNEIATAMFAIRDARANGAETYALETLQKAEALVQQAREVGGSDGERLAERATAYAQLAATVSARDTARQQLADAQKIEREAGALRERTTDAVEERLQ